MNGLSLGALAKITSLAQPKPSWSLVRSAVSLSTCPRARMASMLIPAAVVPTFTDAQTALGRRKHVGKRGDQPALCLGPALLDQRTEAADQVHPDLSGHRVESGAMARRPSVRWPAATQPIG